MVENKKKKGVRKISKREKLERYCIRSLAIDVSWWDKIEGLIGNIYVGGKLECNIRST